VKLADLVHALKLRNYLLLMN